MLELKKITKIYTTDSFKQTALDNVSVSFRQNEFVSILGPSGSGKTTLLNIIGGLDKYSSGDLIINGKSTKEYTDRDWDSYRNHKIGFVFQSYNLIGHQSVLSNVELALTLAGISKNQRKKRAIEALENVGLKDHIYKKPNELSGGQMQRVAIARALVNNPDILLADEPTGALDSKTSKQIMDLLKGIAKDKLVIMVTHNKELAEKYSTRIVELKDGVIKNDTDKYDSVEEKNTDKSKKKTNMSFKTAFSLSLNNLLTKKGRTILISIAGSIGIIGIALIMSLSNGVQDYINRVQEEALTSYPLTIDFATIDFTSAFTENKEKQKEKLESHTDKNIIYSNDQMVDMISIMSSKIIANDLNKFKDYIENGNGKKISDYVTAISYEYGLNINLYKDSDEIVKVNPSTVFENIGMKMDNNMYSNFIINNVFNKLLPNEEINKQMYDVVAGKMPNKYNEVVLVIDKNNQISDYTLYSLGLKDQNELKKLYQKIANGEKIEAKPTTYNYDDLLGLKFKLLLNTDYYKKVGNIWTNKSTDEKYIGSLLKDAETIEIVGIIKPSKKSTVSNDISGGIYYTEDLEKYVIDKINDSKIVKEQKNNVDTNILTGIKFSTEEFDVNKLSASQKAYLSTLSTEELANVITEYKKQASFTYENVLTSLGSVDLENPTSINIYAKDFESKDMVKEVISEYNDSQKDEKDKINYSDMVGLLMSSVTSIVDIISYVLISFVSISLVVSSIMIGIITYISVLERTKEIGILRAVGASKKDIAHVFNAETLIIGLCAGTFGIIFTVLLNIPISLIIEKLSGVGSLCKLPILGGIILIIISAALTYIGGLIPAKMASKKDPVIALRTE